MSAYADTGFLVSLFLEESTSAAADSVIATLEFSLLMTPLIELEFRNALNLAIVRGRITLNERDVVWNKFQEQRSGGIFNDCVIDMGLLFSNAIGLSDRYTPVVATRSLDLLHVAAALLLQVEEFLSIDDRQRRVAQGEGLLGRPG